jgi:hypothetical protein
VPSFGIYVLFSKSTINPTKKKRCLIRQRFFLIGLFN